jgi:repressor of nif and glnA expression
MLMKVGIPVETSFAGVVEVQRGQAVRFTDLIAYAGSSLDPMKVFMGRRVTSVTGAIIKGTGRVLANVREVPVAAAEHACKLLEEFSAAGFGGLMEMGEPSEPILGCPVASGKIGIAFYAGVNGVVAAEEQGARIETAPISMLVGYSRMSKLK